MLSTGYAFMYLIYPDLIIEKGEPERISKSTLLATAADTSILDIERPMIKTVVKTFSKAVSSGKGLFKSKNANKAQVILDPFEFRYLARVFDENEKYKGPDRLCADMVSQKLYPAERYFEVAKKNRLYFNKGDEKIVKKKYYPV